LVFNGIITFKKAQEVRDIVSLTPIEKILLETDSPFLTPVPHRGKENAPFYLPFVAQKVAQIKELPLEEVQEQCYQNSIDLFKF
jgi:TatD DNase family protein